jgi:multiple sugar transport system ATP-binding protein
MSSVELVNVRKTFENNVTVVHDVNLQIVDKEFVVLVGPSGCGKSTTLRMIAGLEEISGGTISIDGVVVNDVPPKDRDIAMVFQNYALYPHMNVFENLAFGLKLRKHDKDEIKQRVNTAAEILGIGHLVDRKPKALSGGQRQRVALGRAIVRQPKVFLFDEPLSNLDANLRVQMRTEISKLHHQLETTMIYVTHDQVEAMSMGDRIVVMKDGYIHQVDSPLNIYNNPADKFVASFIGSPTMNFINGIIFTERELKFNSASKNLILPMPECLREKISPHSGKEVILGIRPEHIHSQSQVSISDMAEVTGQVEVIETVGNEMFIYFTLQGGTKEQLVARIPPDNRLKVGGKFPLYFDTGKLHFFQKDNEKTI